MANSATKKSRKTFRFLAFLESGFFANCIIGAVIGFPLTQNIRLPWLALGFLGLIAGLILYLAEQWKLVYSPGIRYFITIILGLVHAVVSYFFIKFYIIISSSGIKTSAEIILHPLIFILIGFLTVFGYTFFQRLFHPKNNKMNKKPL